MRAQRARASALAFVNLGGVTATAADKCHLQQQVDYRLIPRHVKRLDADSRGTGPRFMATLFSRPDHREWFNLCTRISLRLNLFEFY
ncbi:hypothetical protein LX32DRAFT_693456 [Colletotrichum zoysiae]|uniref:Secreted protein n=1 Tax=Colletotrichum zoysiae TaxID=1216348 RepID=A0AAD9M5I5_9PEZI|nr:hypothetical protein LX32DRAFT_693456 [Colletotrichum zoysiae]